MSTEFTLDGRPVAVVAEGASLLDALREELGVRSLKDGCSPQGQCGCCTVLVDGSPRVACVTAVRRVAGRSVTTVEGIDGVERLARAFQRHGASQCGFCTPGILCRLASLGSSPSKDRVEASLQAHLCRCTGWRGIVDAALDNRSGVEPASDPTAASLTMEESRRATVEGRVPQRIGLGVIFGRGGFADDMAPPGCLVAVPGADGGWAVGEDLSEARQAAGKVQGRRSGRDLSYPLEVPPGDWDITLQTTWVEPAYLEPDSSWCVPGGEPADPYANGGAFGGKATSLAPAAAKELASRYGRPVKVVLSREDVVRLGPKRPPISAGIRLDGSGAMRVVSTPEVAERIKRIAPALTVEEVPVAAPRVSADVRAAGFAEAAILLAVCRATRAGTTVAAVEGLEGGRAEAEVLVGEAGWPSAVRLAVSCGDPLDEVVLRSYLTGAAHMALGWVCSEGIAVDERGVPEDLTIRSYGVIRARDMPPVEIEVDRSSTEPVNGSDPAFAAVAAAVWLAQGLPRRWPTRRGGPQ